MARNDNQIKTATRKLALSNNHTVQPDHVMSCGRKSPAMILSGITPKKYEIASVTLAGTLCDWA